MARYVDSVNVERTVENNETSKNKRFETSVPSELQEYMFESL